MALPRMAPSAKPFTFEVNVNKKLRPYFEVWFQQAKEAGDTPEQFALRVLKAAAINHHIQSNIKAEQDGVEQATIDARDAVNADITAIGTEVD